MGAVLSMTKGEVARVWVPSRLGYGVHGAEPLIPPNTDLVFELTLVEIRNDFAMGGLADGMDDGMGLDGNGDELEMGAMGMDGDEVGIDGMEHIAQGQMGQGQGMGGQGNNAELTTQNINAMNMGHLNGMYEDDGGAQNTFQVL